MTIREIDVATDDTGLHASYLMMRDGYAADPVPYPLDPEPEMQAHLRSLDPSLISVRVLLAEVGGAPVGTAALGFPHRDNQHSARVNHLVVHPAHRRLGIGRSLLDAAGTTAREEGRTVLHGQFRQLSARADSAGREFAEAAGAGLVGRALEQVLDLAAVTTGDLVELREQTVAAAPESVTDYEFIGWQDTAPADLVDVFATLRARMSTDTPISDRPDEPEVWDAARVRDSERRYAAMGRRQIVAATRHRESGALVGYTYLTVATSTPQTAYQEDTLVMAGHRGHRLGLLLKIDALLSIRDLSPQTERIMTWNATINTPMLAVNAALAFQVVAEECEVRLAL
jgi:GNAT superfamily N-acetyltransferase